jgi:hypothetical protein
MKKLNDDVSSPGEVQSLVSRLASLLYNRPQFAPLGGALPLEICYRVI